MWLCKKSSQFQIILRIENICYRKKLQLVLQDFLGFKKNPSDFDTNLAVLKGPKNIATAIFLWQISQIRKKFCTWKIFLKSFRNVLNILDTCLQAKQFKENYLKLRSLLLVIRYYVISHPLLRIAYVIILRNE